MDRGGYIMTFEVTGPYGKRMINALNILYVQEGDAKDTTIFFSGDVSIVTTDAYAEVSRNMANALKSIEEAILHGPL